MIRNRNKILIVDDNRDLADGLADFLEEEKYQTSIAYNGNDAIKFIGNEYFDVALVDMKLPDINGLKCFNLINKHQPDCRVIIMTGYRIEQLCNDALPETDFHMLQDPISEKKLEETLHTISDNGVIIIASANPDNHNLTKDFFKNNGKIIFVAESNKEALDHVFADNNLDLLILNLKESIISGLDVITQLQRNGKHIPVIITKHLIKKSNFIDPLHTLAVTGCLFKPFNPEDILKYFHS